MRPRQADGLAEAHLAPLVSRGVVPSLAWAVVRDQEMVTGGFGGAEPRTVFQIGSVTKVFTALVLADMAERGEVHLLGQAAATPYETLVTTRICVPLGLPDTSFAVPGPRRAARGHRRGRPVPGGQIGLAWHHARRDDRTIIWHNGMTGGFSAMVALDLTRGLGVAALANTAGAPPSPLDRAVLSAFGS